MNILREKSYGKHMTQWILTKKMGMLSSPAQGGCGRHREFPSMSSFQALPYKRNHQLDFQWHQQVPFCISFIKKNHTRWLQVWLLPLGIRENHPFAVWCPSLPWSVLVHENTMFIHPTVDGYLSGFQLANDEFCFYFGVCISVGCICWSGTAGI